MEDLELLHFEQLKAEVQAEYLKDFHPSFDDISKWKGIDIVFFQDDLRKKAKGNISEKSFYTYFKATPATKLPRIDMLNLLSIYAGYQSWYDFKKNHLFANEILPKEENLEEIPSREDDQHIDDSPKDARTFKEIKKPIQKVDLQKNTTENQYFEQKKPLRTPAYISLIKEYFWLLISGVLLAMVLVLVFWQRIFATEYRFTFIDADRNSRIHDVIEIKVLKENETPLQFTINSNKEKQEDFIYATQNKTLKMVVNSPFYRRDTIYRTLDPARTNETIELEPDVYAQALYYYTINNISKKREELDKIISNSALIYQVFDNETYGVETLDKQKYIGLVTTPTTSLKNFKMIETKVSTETKKIILIKFKIQPDEINP